MVTSDVDLEAVFAPGDYLYFYEARLRPDRTAAEVELLWRLIGLQPGLTVLDLACGHGRIANRLAQRGCRVVGLDMSVGFLELAHAATVEVIAPGGVPPAYVRGDMRSLPWREQFDCVINWFTAYGYFEDDDNHRVLEEAQRTLKEGGKLLLELNNRDFMLSRFQHSGVVERDGNLLVDQSRYEVATGRLVTERTMLREGQVRRVQFFVRLFTFPELRDWLHAAGFSSVEGFDERGGPLTLESRRMLVLATK